MAPRRFEQSLADARDFGKEQLLLLDQHKLGTS